MLPLFIGLNKNGFLSNLAAEKDNPEVTLTIKEYPEGWCYLCVEICNAPLNSVYERVNCWSSKEQTYKSFEAVFGIPLSFLMRTNTEMCWYVDDFFVETFLSKKRVIDQLLLEYPANEECKTTVLFNELAF